MNLIVVSVLILTTLSTIVSTNENTIKGKRVFNLFVLSLFIKDHHLCQQAKDTLMKLM